MEPRCHWERGAILLSIALVTACSTGSNGRVIDAAPHDGPSSPDGQAIANGDQGTPGDRPASLDPCANHRGGVLPIVSDVDLQPLAAMAKRVEDTLDYVGQPLAPADKAALAAATSAEDIQRILDAHVLFGVTYGADRQLTVAAGSACPLLDEHGWRNILVKVVNAQGTTLPLNVSSINARPIHRKAPGVPEPRPPSSITRADVVERWLDLALYTQAPFRPELSGLEVEYRILQLYCADRHLGRVFSAADPPPPVELGPFERRARISFSLDGRGVNVSDAPFVCRPAVDVKLAVVDWDGTPTMGAFTIRDESGRVYPSQAKRLAPDFFFHAQVYRKDGEILKLPPGTYTVEATRGPEYVVKTSLLDVPRDTTEIGAAFKLERWVNPAARGYISGDHHIHAAGCSHYDNPTEGVRPEDMWRHIQGEDLRVGCALTWGPCYYFQKQFFSATPHPLSDQRHIMKYDLEISGWSSHRSGHLCLLGLSEQDYPGTKVLEDWPTFGLNVLKWAKTQGAVTGTAHSGVGIEVNESDIPNHTVPPYNGIGAEEFIVQITHLVPSPKGLVPPIDFMAAVDTSHVSELNMWYHVLNAGFRPRLSGETDFPCQYGQRVGLGRSYVRLADPRNIDFQKWIEGVAAGRSYVSDGMSHLMEFAVNGVEAGTGTDVSLAQAGTVGVTAKVAALLPETPDPTISALRHNQKPYWHLERARIGATRTVPVELIVNGRAVAQKIIAADGGTYDVRFDNVAIDQSSWIALRIRASSHTNPAFVMVGARPIRASRRSVQWLLSGVDVLWNSKRPTYAAAELADAMAAYEHARQVYRQRLAEAMSE